VVVSMAVAAAEPQSDWPSIRRVVARHPVASFLIMMAVVNVAVSIPDPLTRRDLLPFDQAPYDWILHIIGLALPAFLVTAAVSGREGVRDLASRSLRWRVQIRWYVLALLGMPVLTIVAGQLFLDSSPFAALADKWTVLFTTVIPHLVLIILISNVFEEIGFTGFLLDRMQDRHSPMKAVFLVGLAFSASHIPGWFVEFGEFSEVAVITAAVFLPHLASRVLAAWFYNNTGRSVLLVGLFHCAFNVTTAEFAREFVTRSGETIFSITSGIAIFSALAIIVLTRGRLSYRPRRNSQLAPS
jgi:membrane protease YdiL (CAAX protease family)